MKMKSIFLVITVLLFKALFSKTLGQLGAWKECCLSHSPRQIPKKYIHHYVETRSDCSKPGLIFVLKRGKKICVNPEDKWVKDRIRFLHAQYYMKTEEKKLRGISNFLLQSFKMCNTS